MELSEAKERRALLLNGTQGMNIEQDIILKQNKGALKLTKNASSNRMKPQDVINMKAQ